MIRLMQSSGRLKLKQQAPSSRWERALRSDLRVRVALLSMS